MGKVKIAETLDCAGLHLGTTTVSRILNEKPHRPAPADDAETDGKCRTVTAKYPNHVWHVDLTAVPASAGYWCSWLPFALPQSWPFCWWVAVAVDHFSHRAIGVTAFKSQPFSRQPQAAIRASLPLACAARLVPSRTPWSEASPRQADVGSQLPCREKALTDRQATPGRVSGPMWPVWQLLRHPFCAHHARTTYFKSNCQRAVQVSSLLNAAPSESISFTPNFTTILRESVLLRLGCMKSLGQDTITDYWLASLPISVMSPFPSRQQYPASERMPMARTTSEDGSGTSAIATPWRPSANL